MPATTSSDDGYRAALRWLSRRSMTRAEVRRRLERQGVDDIESVLDRLVAHQWLSDQAVADGEARSAERRSQGPDRLRARLRARGVEAEVMGATLRQLSADEVYERARRVALGVISREGAPHDEAARVRLVRRLRRQGFSGSVIVRVFRSLQAEPPDEEGAEW